MSRLSDSGRFAKTAVGLSLIASPLLLLVSAVVMPAIKSDAAAQVAVIAQHPARYYLFTICILAGSMLLVPAVLGLMYLARDRAAALGNLGGSLALLGALVAVGDSTSQLVIWQMGAAGADRAQMASLMTRFDEATGSSLVFTIGGFCTLAGIVLLAIALFRARVVPAWTSVGLGVATFLNLAGFGAASIPMLIFSSALLLVTLAPIGLRALREPGSEWAQAPALSRS